MKSAFFWLPAFFEGKYTLRDIVTKGNFTGFANLSKLVLPSWSFGGTGSLSTQVGLIHWLGVILSPFLIWKFWQKKDRHWLLLLFMLFCFWGAVFLILPISKPIYLIITLLQKFQFVWRWLSLAIFPPAVFLAAFVYLLPEKFKRAAVILLTGLVLLLSCRYWQAQDYLLNQDSFYKNVYAGTTDTGERAPC